MKAKFFLLTLCLFGVLTHSNAMTISEVRNQASNTSVTTSGTVTAVYGKNAYIHDHESGILVYFNSNITDISVGDSMTVSGTYTVYQNYPEIKNPTVTMVPATTNVPVIESTIADVMSNSVALLGSIVQITNTKVSRYDTRGNLYITDGTNEIECHLMCPSQTDFPVGKEISLKAVVDFYNFNPQLVGNSSDVVIYVPEQEENPNKTYDFEKDGCYYNILSISDRTVQLTCKGDENDEYNNRIATYSGNFRVPETVEYSNRTFTVTSIHPLAFINCNLGTLTIPATVQVFSGTYGTCRYLVIEDSEIPLNCGYYKVYNSVYLGRNLKDLNSGIGGEYSTITFGNYVTELGYLCNNCQNLTSVTLPASIKKLYRTFQGCKNLKTVSGEGVESMSDVFTGSGIETINMPNLKMMNGDFQNCTSLQSMVMPAGLIKLGESYQSYGGVFSNATSLTNVYIPSTVISMGQNCFSGCTALQTISVANPNPIEINENNFDALTYLNATLKVPVGSRTKYMYAPVWSNFLNIEEDASLVATSATVSINKGYTYGGNLSYAFSAAVDTFQESSSKIYYVVPVGCTMTITIQPAENYVLSSLTINGEDVTNRVVNNEYSIVINGSATVSINAQFEYNYTPEPQGENVSIVYVDKDSEYLDEQGVTLYLPEAPEIEGFTFIGWQPVAALIENVITIQAIYQADEPASAPAVYANPANPAQKLVRNGNVYILQGEKVYTITGAEVK